MPKEFKEVRFYQVEPGQLFWRDGQPYVKEVASYASSTDCSGCFVPRDRIWNARRNNTDDYSHFCPDEEVQVREE